MDAIAIEGLTKYYGGILALNRLSLRIRRGVCAGLLGPNGAGKSTTLKILCGLIKPTAGRAYVNGVDVVERPLEALRAIGAIIEVPEFYQELTAWENLAYLGRLRGLSGRRLDSAIRDSLELVGLSEWARVKVGKFSRGMKQRLAIAQAVLHDPPILILDEPLLGLDPRGISEMREVIKRMKAEGKTVFLASHILSEVEQLCDEVAIINRGVLLAQGSIADLSRMFASKRFEAELAEEAPEAKLAELSKLDGVKSIRAMGRRLLIEFEGDEFARADLLKAMVGMGLRVCAFRPSLGALEEVYLQVVAESR